MEKDRWRGKSARRPVAEACRPRDAAVTEPLHVTADGTLFVAVKTSAWMSELSLLEPELLRVVNGTDRFKPIRKIRFRLMR